MHGGGLAGNHQSIFLGSYITQLSAISSHYPDQVNQKVLLANDFFNVPIWSSLDHSRPGQRSHLPVGRSDFGSDVNGTFRSQAVLLLQLEDVLWGYWLDGRDIVRHAA